MEGHRFDPPFCTDQISRPSLSARFRVKLLFEVSLLSRFRRSFRVLSESRAA